MVSTREPQTPAAQPDEATANGGTLRAGPHSTTQLSQSLTSSTPGSNDDASSALDDVKDYLLKLSVEVQNALLPNPHKRSALLQEIVKLLPRFKDTHIAATKTSVSLCSATAQNGLANLLAETETKTFEAFLKILRVGLAKAGEDEVSMCCITSIPSTYAGVKVPRGWTVTELPARRRLFLEIPRLAMLLTVIRYWEVSDNAAQTMLREPEWRSQQLIPFTEFSRWTSRLQSQASNQPTSHLYRLTWCRTVPEWKSDFYMYIWQAQKSAPLVERADLYLFWPNASHWRAILLKTSDSSTSYERSKAFLKQASSMFRPADETPQEARKQAASVILSLLDLMVRDNISFRDDCVKLLSEIRLSGRNHPSRQKINFLLHLDDFRQSAQSGLAVAKEIRFNLPRLAKVSFGRGNSSSLPSSPQINMADQYLAMPDQSDLFKEYARVGKSLTCLEADFDKLGKLFQEARGEIREQMDLRQISFSKVLALLAAIFLPFSFISGMFGMNMRDPLWTAPGANSGNDTNVRGTNRSASNKTLAASLPSSRASGATTLHDLTLAFENALSAQPSSHLWSFKQFWYIAVTVTAVTLILPMVAAPTFRAIIRFSYKHKDLSGMILAFSSLGVVYTLGTLVGPIAVIVLGTVQFPIAIAGLAVNAVQGLRYKRWIVYLALLNAALLSALFDGEYAGRLTSSTDWFGGPVDYFQWRGALIPYFWGCFLWYRHGQQLLSLKSLEASERPICKRLSQLISKMKWHSKKFQIVLLVILEGVNAAYNYLSPTEWYCVFSFTLTGLYALQKLIQAIVGRKGQVYIFWILFAAVAAASDLWWWFGDPIGFAYYAGAPLLFPGIMLWAFHSRQGLEISWKKVAARWRRSPSDVSSGGASGVVSSV